MSGVPKSARKIQSKEVIEVKQDMNEMKLFK